MHSNLRYSLLVLLAAFIAGISWIATEIILNDGGVGTAVIASFSNILGGLLLVIVYVRSNPSWYRTVGRTDWGILLATGLIYYAVGYWLNFNGIKLIGSGKAVLLARMDVFILIVLAVIFLGEKVTRRHLAACLLAIVGTLLINFDPAGLRLNLGTGEIYILLAACSAAIGTMNLKLLIDRINTQLATGLALFLGGSFLFPLAILDPTIGDITTLVLLGIIMLGILRGAAWFSFNVAMKQIGTVPSTIIFLSSSFFTVILQAVLANLFPSWPLQLPDNLWLAFLGGGFVAAGIVVLNWSAINNNFPEP